MAANDDRTPPTHRAHRAPAAYVAEAIGTFLLVLTVCSVLSHNSASQLGLAGIALLHVFVLWALIYSLGGTSGAHFNPAVTLALLAVRKIGVRDAAVYILVQVVAAMLGAFVARLLFEEVGALAGYGAIAIDPDVLQDGSALLGLLAEALGTFILVWAIMGVAVNPRGESPFAGLVIGGALGVGVLAFGPATGAGMNPARWLATAVASGESADAWLYILGPVIGGVIAAVAYQMLILDERGLFGTRPIDVLEQPADRAQPR